MSLFAKLIISLIIAAIAATLTSLMSTGELFNAQLMIAFCVATVVTALVTHSHVRAPSPAGAAPEQQSTSSDAGRETGEVKWFNISKGFGFITREDGEEIFVHFRSIRGEGRRGLRDGQRVSFVVAQSDKGPQAEDVVGED
jgi:CspA family cold shock protein